MEPGPIALGGVGGRPAQTIPLAFPFNIDIFLSLEYLPRMYPCPRGKARAGLQPIQSGKARAGLQRPMVALSDVIQVRYVHRRATMG